MSQYVNRLSCKQNKNTKQNNDEPALLEKLKCGKQIVSISQIEEQVVVMYSDCSYSVTTKDKLNLSSFENRNLILLARAIKTLHDRIELLETKEDKDTVYNDSELRDRIVALESKEDKDTVYNDAELREKLTNVENRIPDVSTLATKQELTEGLKTKVNTDDLVVIENLEGTADLFKAVKL